MTEPSPIASGNQAADEGSATLSPDVSLLVTVLQSLIGRSVVLFVARADGASAIAAGKDERVEPVDVLVRALEEHVHAWLANTDESEGHGAATLAPGWQILMVEARQTSGERVGAVVVARESTDTNWSDEEISTIRTFAAFCGSSFDRHAAPSEAPQGGLDDLVTKVAVKLMSVSAGSLRDAQDWTLRVLTEFFEVDTSFLRRNDFDRSMTVLTAEWPVRENVPDPDPLGEVPFGADPVFDATFELQAPFVMRPQGSPDAYQERVQQGSGVDLVSIAMVPLIRERTTVGVLGFIKFGDRPWDTHETNALQAVASLLVQLQARVEAEEQLAYRAHHDELTGLPNRRALVEELHRSLSDNNDTSALLVLDLDRFKAMNEFLGRAAGDQLLVTIAKRLRAAMGAGDFVARLAADQFAVILGGQADQAEKLMETHALLSLVSEPIEIAGHQISRTASMGISIGELDSTTAEERLGHADAALRLAKTHSGGQVVVFDEALRIAVEQRSHTELLLRGAIDHGGLLLYYQPEIDLRSGRLVALEALVRWNHPQRGILAAGSFIAVAEESGLIVDLGQWVLGEACRQIATWRKQHPHLDVTMRVNMSPAQLASRNIVQLVAERLNDNHLPGQTLCLEITEHAVMQDVHQAVETLQELRSLGVSLAIDDFGTGFSSMSQLKRLPVDCLKIDQTFVSGLGGNDADRAIVDATVRLAESFGLDLVAEGIETVEMVHELLNLGCHRGQGYLLCRPSPASELEAILAQGGLDPLTFTSHQMTTPDPTE